MKSSETFKKSKFLDSIIKPYILNSNIIQSSEEFLNKINTFNFNSSNQFLVIFDVKLLFTNVPLNQGFLTGGKFTPGVNFAYPGGKFAEL